MAGEDDLSAVLRERLQADVAAGRSAVARLEGVLREEVRRDTPARGVGAIRSRAPPPRFLPPPALTHPPL